MSKFVRAGLVALIISGASVLTEPQVSFGAAIRDMSATEMEAVTRAVIINNLSSHKGHDIRGKIGVAGAMLVYLPPPTSTPSRMRSPN